jgi:hypothetical protein
VVVVVEVAVLEVEVAVLVVEVVTVVVVVVVVDVVAVVVVVVVQPPSYEAWVSSPQAAHSWSEVAVATTLMYDPCVP